MANSKKTRRLVLLVGALLVGGARRCFRVDRQAAVGRSRAAAWRPLRARRADGRETWRLAASGDIPIRLSALGTITPLATRNDQDADQRPVLQQIAFTEGQMVDKGQFPGADRPAAVRERASRRSKACSPVDEAQLRNVQRDVERYAGLASQQQVSEQQLATTKALDEQLAGHPWPRTRRKWRPRA